ncbi:MAG: ABC transporter permease [Erysipelotrichales bacterium]|nr:MAG: ABC transporter permease [Erysipelotrichales bacterium]
MRPVMQLTLRNIRLFLRNKAEVFFSFLSVFIILGLYVLFLGDVQIQNLKSLVGGDFPEVETLVYAWMMSGLVAVSSVTLSLGALGRMVQDRERKVFNDFMVAPIHRWQLILAYLFSTLIISFSISFVLFIASQVVLVMKGAQWMPLVQSIQVLGIIVLLTLSSGLLLLFAISFVHTETVYSLISTIVGTLIGFVTGAYMPMGVMPRIVQDVCNLIPVSQGASLLRHLYMNGIIERLFEGAPVETVTNYRLLQGIDLTLNKITLTDSMMLFYLLGSIGFFLILSIVRFNAMKN